MKLIILTRPHKVSAIALKSAQGNYTGENSLQDVNNK